MNPELAALIERIIAQLTALSKRLDRVEKDIEDICTPDSGHS